MDQSWRDLNEPNERLSWARMKLTAFQRPTDAAKSLNIKPGTYRTYELPKSQGGRWPGNSEVQRIAKKFGVSWLWLLTGQGDPADAAVPELQVYVEQLAERVSRITEDKREDAFDAAKAVLDAYIRKAG
jgi:hypothetical protein